MMKIMTLHLQDKEKGVASPDVVGGFCGKLVYYGTKNHLDHYGMVFHFYGLFTTSCYNNHVPNNAPNIINYASISSPIKTYYYYIHFCLMLGKEWVRSQSTSRLTDHDISACLIRAAPL